MTNYHNGPKTDHNGPQRRQRRWEVERSAKTNEEDNNEDVRTDGEADDEDDERRKRRKKQTVRENDEIGDGEAERTTEKTNGWSKTMMTAG